VSVNGPSSCPEYRTCKRTQSTSRGHSPGGSGDALIVPKKRKMAAESGATVSKRCRGPKVFISTPGRKGPPQLPKERSVSLTHPTRFLTKEGVLDTMRDLSNKVEIEVSIMVDLDMFNSP